MKPEDTTGPSANQSTTETPSASIIPPTVISPASPSAGETSAGVENPGSTAAVLASNPPQAQPTDTASLTPSTPAIESSLSQPLAAASGETASPAVSQPVVSQPVAYSAGGGAPVAPAAAGSRSKKPWIVGGVAAVTALLLIAGTVFGYYLPNTPGRVWTGGLERSGKALAAVVNKAAEPKTVERFQHSKMKLDAELIWDEFKGELTWNGSSDDKNARGNLVISVADGENSEDIQQGTLDYLLQYADTQIPDAYFKVSGLKNVSLADYDPRLVSYIDKWILVNADTLKQYYPNASEDVGKDKRVTSQDVADAAKALTETIQEYVLTGDSEKAVLVQKEFIGKETVDGIKTHHYKAGINRANAGKYCEVLVQKMTATKFYQKVTSGNPQSEEDKKTAIKDCQQSVDSNFKDTDMFDVWVDSKYRLIHKIRIPNEQGKDIGYIEFGQNYKGGDDIALFARDHTTGESPYDAEWTLNTNMATGITTSKITGKSTGSSAEKFAFTVNFKSEPSQEKVDPTIPKDAVPITTIFNTPASPAAGTENSPTDNSSISNRAKDTQRQTDINAITAHVEAFYAYYGFYPTVADLQDKAFVAKYMKGLNPESLLDPNQTSGTIQAMSSQSSPSYAYVAGAKNGIACSNTTRTSLNEENSPTDNGCDTFVLVATLSDGKPYTKQSF